jgi:hypothetical protein
MIQQHIGKVVFIFDLFFQVDRILNFFLTALTYSSLTKIKYTDIIKKMFLLLNKDSLNWFQVYVFIMYCNYYAFLPFR